MEFILAAPQEHMGKKNMGHFSAAIEGKIAEDSAPKIRVGRVFKIAGTLWTRSFLDRKGNRVSETKVLIDTIEEENREKE